MKKKKVEIYDSFHQFDEESKSHNRSVKERKSLDR